MNLKFNTGPNRPWDHSISWGFICSNLIWISFNRLWYHFIILFFTPRLSKHDLTWSSLSSYHAWPSSVVFSFTIKWTSKFIEGQWHIVESGGGGVITWSNITWYCIYCGSDWCRIWISVWTTKDTTYLALTGELWGVFCKKLGRKLTTL